MSRSARLLALMQSLRRRRGPVSAAALAAEFGVSVRTVYRDISVLVAEGAAIEGEPGFGYVVRPGFFLPPLALTNDECEAVVLGLRFVAQRGDPQLAAAAADALGKVAAIAPDSAERAAAFAPLLAGPAGSAGIGRLPDLRRAMRSEVKLGIRYRDGRGAESERTVWPVAVGFFDAVEVLAAWCELRGGFRHFRLDRIVSARPTGEPLPRARRVLLAEWRGTEGLRNLL